MGMLGWVIIITAIAGIGGTGLGGLVGALFKKNTEKPVGLLLRFAGGGMYLPDGFLNLDDFGEQTGMEKPGRQKT